MTPDARRQRRTEVLTRAIEILRERGWVSMASGPNGEVCVGIALNHAAFALETAAPVDRYEANHDAHAALMTFLGGLPVTWWNDNVCQNSDEAIDVLKRAIDVDLPASADKP